jgi:putative hydrolase of the HAD superfamily
MIVHNPLAFEVKPSCVLLELDNTLYAHEPCNAAGMEAARALSGRLLNLSASDFDRCFSTAKSEVKARLEDTGSAHSRLLYFQRTLERAGFASHAFAALQLEQAYWRAHMDVAVLFDHALDFLDDLRIAGVSAVIVTDLTSQIQLRKMILFGLDRTINWIVSSEESGRDKPHAASFELALAKLGGIEGTVWMVGDDHRCDLSGAKAAIGAVTLQKLHRGVPPAPMGSAYVDARFESFADLRTLFNGSLKRDGASKVAVNPDER